MLDRDERRAEALLGEMNLRIMQSDSTADVSVFRRLWWASRGAAEAVRILETHRRASGLTPTGLETLEWYRKFYDAAELILVGHFPYHKDPATTGSYGLPGLNG